MAVRTRVGTGEPIMVSDYEMKRLQQRVKALELKLKELERMLRDLKLKKKEPKKK
jgi:hypothetical protein